MAHLARAALIAVAIGVRAAQAAELPEESAQKHLRDLKYVEARALLESALKQGGLGRERLLAVRFLQAQVLAAMEGADAGEREYRRLLVLDPHHPPPEKKSPVILAPFERARRWVQQNGTLQASAAALSPTEVEARVASDPLSMVAGARVFAGPESGELTRVAGSGLRATVPEGSRRYYIELVDGADNVLARAGTPQDPLRLPVPVVEKPAPPPAQPPPPVAPVLVKSAPPPRTPHMLYAGIGVGVASLAFFGAGIGLDRAAVSEFETLQRRCAPACTDNDLATFRLERNLSYVSFAVGGAAALTAIILIAVDRARAHGSK